MKHILFLIITFTISCKVFAQNNDSVFLKGQLFLFDTLSGEEMPVKEGVVDIYYKKDAHKVKKLHFYDFEELRVERCFSQDDGTFNIKLPKSGKYHIRLYDSNSDIIEKNIKVNTKSINLGHILLPDMKTVKGRIIGYTEYTKGDSENSEHAEIMINTKTFKDPKRRRLDRLVVKNYSTLGDGAFEFKLRKGKYVFIIAGNGLTEIEVNVKSETIDLGDVNLGPLMLQLQ